MNWVAQMVWRVIATVVVTVIAASTVMKPVIVVCMVLVMYMTVVVVPIVLSRSRCRCQSEADEKESGSRDDSAHLDWLI